MDPVTIVLALAFIGVGLAFYFTRKFTSKAVRVALALTTVLFCGLTVWRATTVAARTEAVWQAESLPWDHVPVRVWVDRAGLSDFDNEIDGAIKIWNGRLDFAFFVYASDRAHADVLLRSTDGTPCGTELESATALASACIGGTVVDIQVYRLSDSGTALRVFVHELGHAIGLAHDRDGAMAPDAAEPGPNDAPEYLLPSNKDVGAIRAKYGSVAK